MGKPVNRNGFHQHAVIGTTFDVDGLATAKAVQITAKAERLCKAKAEAKPPY